MPEELFTFTEKPEANYLIAGWRRQWSNGGRISSGLPRYLIEKKRWPAHRPTERTRQPDVLPLSGSRHSRRLPAGGGVPRRIAQFPP